MKCAISKDCATGAVNDSHSPRPRVSHSERLSPGPLALPPIGGDLDFALKRCINKDSLMCLSGSKIIKSGFEKPFKGSFEG